MDKKKHISIMVIVIILIACGAFYAGMKYDASTAQTRFTQMRNGGQGFGGGRQNGQNGPLVRGGGPNNGAGDFIGGEISAKDDTSITLKTRDGGSRIIFFSGATSVDKSVSGNVADLSIGQQVMITGKSNPDGSLAAQNIQIRPTQNQQ